MRWQANEISRAGVYGASLTAEPISYEALVGVDPTVQRVDIVVTAATAGAGITAVLQEFNGSAWVTVKTSGAIAAAGVVSFVIHPQDGSFVVLRERIRVVINTGAGSSITVATILQYRVED